jgi:hypothetical protein
LVRIMTAKFSDIIALKTSFDMLRVDLNWPSDVINAIVRNCKFPLPPELTRTGYIRPSRATFCLIPPMRVVARINANYGFSTAA